MTKNDEPSKNDIKIGTAHQTHGVKGAFIFKSFQNFADETVLKAGLKVMIKPLKGKAELEGKEFEIAELKIGQKIIVTFKGIHSIDEIKKLLPFEVYLDRELFPEIENEGEFYLTDLIGLTAIDNSTQEKLGIIDSSYPNGAQEVLVIRLVSELSSDQENFLELPFVGPFFPEVDLQRGLIFVNVPQIIED